MADAPRAAERHMSPFRFLMAILLAIAALIGAAGIGFVAYGRDAVWTDLVGPADTGPYDFEQPTRTGKVNDALFCPVGDAACEAAAVDRGLPLYATDAPTLLAAVRETVASMPGADFVEDNPDDLSFRAVVRTPLLRFPDTVSVRVREQAPGLSAVWLYSRSRIGHADLGANERRLRVIQRGLAKRFETVRPEAG